MHLYNWKHIKVFNDFRGKRLFDRKLNNSVVGVLFFPETAHEAQSSSLQSWRLL